MIALCSVGGLVQAQDYPNKSISLVVGFPPGGSNDIVARLFAPKLTEILGQSVVVVNKSGSNGLIGTDFVAKAAPVTVAPKAKRTKNVVADAAQ
jgi:tripartite-type tricarboxylate transporter receptor subunit TctC